VNNKKMRTMKIIFFLVFSLVTVNTFGTTWDEPWQEEVIKDSDYFVFANVVSNDKKEGVTIEIIKSLGGKKLKGKIKITDFYLLDYCSHSIENGTEFRFDGVKESYFFIKKNDKGKYCIATPTSGFAFLKDSIVQATYRHSYHKAVVPIDIYEKTMTAIFNNYHSQPYDKQFITDYIKKYIVLRPAGFANKEINTFFAQHVALECVYHLRLTDFYSQTLSFLADTSNFHHQVSAARALISHNTIECKRELLKVITDTSMKDFVQVICIWTLSEFKPTELKEQLLKVRETASTEKIGFGGDIMDPRVCTFFPDVKQAIENLLQTLE
jgi:hypothetical protein